MRLKKFNYEIFFFLNMTIKMIKLKENKVWDKKNLNYDILCHNCEIKVKNH